MAVDERVRRGRGRAPGGGGSGGAVEAAAGGRGRASGRGTSRARRTSEDRRRPARPRTSRRRVRARASPRTGSSRAWSSCWPTAPGFVRVEPPEPSDEDVYISAAQVQRCELVSGDRVSGPRRARRGARSASPRWSGSTRSTTVRPTRWPTAPASRTCPPRSRRSASALGSDDPTVKAIELLTPFGRGSRVAIVGAAGAGKTEALRRLLAALVGRRGDPDLASRSPGCGPRRSPSGAPAHTPRRSPLGLGALRPTRRTRRSSSWSSRPAGSPPAARTRSS